MKKFIIWPVLVECVVILISVFAIISRGGHSGMMIFLLLHTPSSVVSIFIGEYLKHIFSSETAGAVSVVFLSVLLQLVLFALILLGLKALVERLRSIKQT